MIQFIISTKLLILCLTLGLLSACQEAPRYTPLNTGTVVMAFGDSVTYGVGAAKGEDYPTLLAQKTGWHVVNAGISGDTAQNARSRIGRELSTHQPGLVLIELGGNDFLRKRPATAVKSDLQSIIDESLASGAITVLVAVPRLSMLRASIGALSDSPIYAELAEENNLVLIENVFSEILSEENLLADRIHPNAEGYRQFAEGIVESLSEVGLTP